MAFEGWSPERLEEVQKGLLLLGWQVDDRLTSGEGAMIEEVAQKALRLDRAEALTPEVKEELAIDAFEIMSFQIMNVDERAFMAHGVYSKSRYFAPLLSLIDEGTICFYRGYYTASLAILFIILESYLRDLMGWTPGMPDPKFYELKAAIQHLPSSSSREHATQILSVVYERYDPLSPSQFLFNRHGLLHGVRGPDDVDEMNCARMFTLFDTLCDAEGLYRMLVHDDEFRLRHSAYKNCIKTGNEQKLLKEIARAEKTVAAYRLELATRSQEREPLQWARTQRDLGDALITLVERGGGVSDFKEAKAAYRAALKVQAPEPLEWARTQTSMATLFAALGKRQKSSNWLKRAVGLYRVALGKLTPKSAPREWAIAQNNLAHALEEWGVLSGDSALFVEAAKAWDECLAAAPEVWPEKLVEYVKSRLAGLRRRN